MSEHTAVRYTSSAEGGLLYSAPRLCADPRWGLLDEIEPEFEAQDGASEDTDRALG